MKFIVSFFLTILLSFAGSLFLPWWIIAVAAFLVAALIHQRPFKAFLAGFIALFALWGVQAILIDNQNEHLLATKVAAILPLGGSYIALILVTAFIGGLVAGMSALTASFLRGSRRKPIVTTVPSKREKVHLKKDVDVSG
jgi:vacuolar-type H+-ATPase subunit F/Vma7